MTTKNIKDDADAFNAAYTTAYNATYTSVYAYYEALCANGSMDTTFSAAHIAGITDAIAASAYYTAYAATNKDS